MDGSHSLLAAHTSSVVVMVEGTYVGIGHRVSAHFNKLGNHRVGFRCHIDVIPNTNRFIRPHLQPRTVFDTSTGPHLHTTVWFDHKVYALPKIQSLPASVQLQPGGEPRLGYHDPNGAQAPFSQLP
jgi:hypothetical protein